MTKTQAILWAVLRGLFVTIMASAGFSLLVMFFSPEVSDPHGSKELGLTNIGNIVGIVIWAGAAVLGILNGVRFWKKWKKQADEGLLPNDCQ